MATCDSSHVCGEVVRLLLEAGADPVLAQAKGLTPLHVVALHGHTDLVDTLHSRAPATLNRCATKAKRRSSWRASEVIRAWCPSCCRWGRRSRWSWMPPPARLR
ncbi:unnamed protein product [Laminaria digitata]